MYWFKCLQLLNKSGRLTYAEFSFKQIQCIFYVLVYSMSSIIFPSFISKIVDNGIALGNTEKIVKYTIALLLTGIIMLVFNYLYQVNFYEFSQKFVAQIKEIFFERLMKTNIFFWNKHAVGDMFTILEEDISSIETLFTHAISGVLSNTLILCGISIYIIYINWIIGVTVIAITFLLAIIQKKYGHRIEQHVLVLREDIADFSSYTNEVLNNVSNISMTGGTEQATERYCTLNSNVVKKAIIQLRMITILQSIVSSYSVISIFIVMMVGASKVLHNEMSIGVLFSLTIYVQKLFGPLSSLGNEYVSFKKNAPIFKRIFEVLESKEMIKSGDYVPSNGVSGNIKIKEVCFSYNELNSVFDNFNLSIRSGEIVAIIGENGCGKTTLMRLLTKECEPQKGNIFIDNIDLKDYQWESLQNNIGCFLQNEYILSDTLRKVLDVNQSHSDNQIIQLMDEFYLNLSEFPKGLDTIIGENTLNLSGGQVQKICLIRLFLQSKNMYILDEPTSAIDIKSEKQICDVLKRKLEGKTAIIITHREEILRICSRKIVLTKEE